MGVLRAYIPGEGAAELIARPLPPHPPPPYPPPQAGKGREGAQPLSSRERREATRQRV